MELSTQDRLREAVRVSMETPSDAANNVVAHILVSIAAESRKPFAERIRKIKAGERT